MWCQSNKLVLRLSLFFPRTRRCTFRQTESLAGCWNNDDRDGNVNGNGKRSEQYRIRWAKHQLCGCITLSFLSFFFFFFYISWPRCTTTTWKFLIKRFIEGVIKTKRSFFLKLDIVHRRQIKQNWQHLTNWTQRNNSDDVWRRTSVLLSDFFAIVADVGAEAPLTIWQNWWTPVHYLHLTSMFCASDALPHSLLASHL